MFTSPITTSHDHCPIGRLEDVEARLEAIEEAVLSVARAFTIKKDGA